jgi:hypothetical protein
MVFMSTEYKHLKQEWELLWNKAENYVKLSLPSGLSLVSLIEQVEDFMASKH